MSQNVNKVDLKDILSASLTKCHYLLDFSNESAWDDLLEIVKQYDTSATKEGLKDAYYRLTKATPSDVCQSSVWVVDDMGTSGEDEDEQSHASFRDVAFLQTSMQFDRMEFMLVEDSENVIDVYMNRSIEKCIAFHGGDTVRKCSPDTIVVGSVDPRVTERAMTGVDKCKGLLSKSDFFNAFAKMILSEPWNFNLTKPFSGRIFKKEKTPDASPKSDQRTSLDLTKAPCGAEGMQRSSSRVEQSSSSSGQRPTPPHPSSLNGSLNGSNTGPPRLPKTPRMQDDDEDDADSDDNGGIMNLWQVNSPVVGSQQHRKRSTDTQKRHHRVLYLCMTNTKIQELKAKSLNGGQELAHWLKFVGSITKIQKEISGPYEQTFQDYKNDPSSSLSPYSDNLKTSLKWIFSTNEEPTTNVYNAFDEDLKKMNGATLEKAKWFEENVLMDHRQVAFRKMFKAQAKKAFANKDNNNSSSSKNLVAAVEDGFEMMQQ